MQIAKQMVKERGSKLEGKRKPKATGKSKIKGKEKRK